MRTACRRQRCTKPSRIVGLCASHATTDADRRFSTEIRSRGLCQLRSLLPSIECRGQLQCAHLISRRYRATRWQHINAVAACGAHHLWMDHHPLEKDQIIDKLLGADVYADLRRQAIAGDWRPWLAAYLEAM